MKQLTYKNQTYQINYGSDLKSLIPTSLFTDKRLSEGARFVAMYLCSLPKDWVIRIEVIAKNLNIDKKTASKRLKEIFSSDVGYFKPQSFVLDMKDLDEGMYDISAYESNEDDLNAFITSHAKDVSQCNIKKVYVVQSEYQKYLLNLCFNPSEDSALAGSVAFCKFKPACFSYSERGGRGLNCEVAPLPIGWAGKISHDSHPFLGWVGKRRRLSDVRKRTISSDESASYRLQEENFEQTLQTQVAMQRENLKRSEIIAPRLPKRKSGGFCLFGAGGLGGNPFSFCDNKPCKEKSKEAKNNKSDTSINEIASNASHSRNDEQAKNKLTDFCPKAASTKDSKKVENFPPIYKNEIFIKDSITHAKKQTNKNKESLVNAKNKILGFEMKKASFQGGDAGSYPSGNDQVDTAESRFFHSKPNRAKKHLSDYLDLSAYTPTEQEAIRLWIEYKSQYQKGALLPAQIDFQLRKIARLKECGQDITEVIERSIDKGWKGLFPIKNSVLGNHLSDFGNFESSQTISLASLPKFPKSTQSNTANPRILEYKEAQGSNDNKILGFESETLPLTPSAREGEINTQAEGFLRDFGGCADLSAETRQSVCRTSENQISSKITKKPTLQSQTSNKARILGGNL